MSIRISDPTLQHLFGKPIRYTIPPYQRRYRWTEEPQWQPLWDDVEELANDWLANPNQATHDPHFCGAIVLRPHQNATKEPENREVIDGQQRLTTMQVLLDAAQEVFQEHSAMHASLLAHLILNDDIYTETDRDFRFKVWPSRYDREAFRAVMDDQSPTEGYEDSRIFLAHQFFRKEIADWIELVEGEAERVQRCEALTSVLTQRLQFVEIVVESSGIANEIFETLNARGTPLQAWDLVKNYLYERAGNSPDFEDWFDDEMVKFDTEWWQDESGSGRNARSNVDLFLNHFLVLRTTKEVKGRTANDVHRAFSAYMKEPDLDAEKSARGVGSDFSRLGEVYRGITQAQRSDPHGNFLHSWRVQGNNSLAPVILWLWSSGAPDDELDLAVRALDSYFGRRLVCQAVSKDYRELTIGLLGALNESGPSSVGDVTKRYLRERAENVETLRWPSDDEIRFVLQNRQMYGKLTAPRVQLILESIERQLRLEARVSEPLPEQSRSIEHVMPQKWQAYWQAPSPQDQTEDETATQRRNRLLHTIGNLTLVNSRLNSKLRHGPWDQKRELLKEHSKLYLSNDLIDHDDPWDESAIIERSRKHAEVLIRVWPTPDRL